MVTTRALEDDNEGARGWPIEPAVGVGNSSVVFKRQVS